MSFASRAGLLAGLAMAMPMLSHPAASAADVTAEEAAQLKALGFSDAQVRELADASPATRPAPLTEADVAAMARAGHSAREILDAIAATGSTFQLTPRSALELVRDKVPLAVLRVMRGQPPDAADLAEHVHVARHFVLRYPRSWRLMRQISLGSVLHVITPEPQTADAKRVKVGIALLVMPIGPAVSLVGSDPVAVLKYELPVLRFAEPGLKPVGEVTAGRLGRLRSAELKMQGAFKDKQGSFAATMILAVDGEHAVALTVFAPADQAADMQPTFEKILRDSDFGRPRPPRLPRPAGAAELAERYKAAVVAVSTEQGTGSGVVISPDGYVLTNWHVIWNKAEGRPAKQIFVEWDETADQRKVVAELVGWSSRPSEAVFLGGIDVALLKLPPGRYTAAPLTDLADVQLGDGAVAMGFPQRGRVSGVSLFVTDGIVVRFNRSPFGRVESIFTSAKVASGSSGGPCFSTATGGVLGLNTWRQPFVTKAEDADLNDMVGYYSVCTMQDAMAEFPLVTRLGRDPTGADLDFLDAFELSGLLLNQGTGKAAVRIARRAAELSPRSADAQCRLGLACLLAAAGGGDPQAAAAAGPALQEALRCDPTHEDTLVLLAETNRAADNLPLATEYADKAVAAHPQSWQTYYTRANLDITAARYPQAAEDLQKAKELSLGLLPLPFMTSGMVQYALGKLDEGKADFEQACRIQPSSLQARIGVIEYLEHKKQYEQAIAAYEALLPEFRRHPELLTRIGTCLEALGRVDEAMQQFGKAVGSAEFAHRAPPAIALLELGNIAAEIKKNTPAAVVFFTKLLLYHGRSPLAPSVHMSLARLYGKSLAAVIYAHVRRAHSLRPSDASIAKALAETPAAGLTADNIVQLLNLEYPPAVLADLVRNTPLAFRLENETSAQRLAARGVPYLVLDAIDESLRSTPPLAAAGTRDLRLIGKWNASVRDAAGAEVGRVWLDFGGQADGWSLVTTRQLGSAAPAQDVGSWNADGKMMWGKDQAGAAWRFDYELDGDQLTIHRPESQGGPAVYRRITGN